MSDIEVEKARVRELTCRHCGAQYKSGGALNDHLWAKHKDAKLPPASHVITTHNEGRNG